MARWLPWPERRREIQQALAFAAAGVGDLVNVDRDDDEDDLPRCPECWWVWPDGTTRCAGCGYPEALDGEVDA
jgi:hypothetical protein